MSIWSKSITADAAFWGIVTGFFGNIAAKLLSVYEIVDLPVLLDPFVIGLVLSVCTIILVSRAGTVSDAERDFLTRIHVTPGEELDDKKTKYSMRISAYLMLTGVLMFLAVCYFYVLPYQSALESNLLNSTANESSLLILSGEFFMTLLYCGALVLSGYFARRWLKRFYAITSVDDALAKKEI
jgi:sodium/pantothenate symporter